MWGEVREDEAGRYYFSPRRGEHFCWKFRGYGIQYDLFQALERAGVEYIAIQTPTQNLVSSLKTWSNKGTIAILREEDGEQIFLADGMQEEVRERQENQKAKSQTTARQCSLEKE